MSKARRGALSRETIVAAGVTVADRGGVARLSMRALAKELGVEAMSLYHHVRNKDDLLDGMVDSVFAEIHLPVIGAEDWAAQLRARTVSGRDVLTRHPWAVPLMESRRTPGSATLRHHDATIGCLREAGFSLPMTGHAVALLDAYLYGFMVQQLTLPIETDVEVTEVAAPIVEQVGDAMPYLVEFATRYAMQPGYRFTDEFEVGLDMVLDAVARWREAEEQGAAAAQYA